MALDFRETVQEENGGGDGNSSVADLEVRVETLEGTAADHETRISATELDIDGNFSMIITKYFDPFSMNFILFDHLQPVFYKY